MHILFVDESGTPPKPGKRYPRYFVVGGIIIPENAWHRIRDAMLGLKIRHRIRGELKWRYFSPNNDDPKNPIRKLDQISRDHIRAELYRIICTENSVKTIASVCSPSASYQMPSIVGPDDIYHLTYKTVSERFQYYLQDLSSVVGRKEFGIIVGDHRGPQDDKRLRRHHQMLLHSSAEFTSTYDHLVEGLFLEPSNLSVGIQLADMVSGAVWRKYERDDDKWYQAVEPSIRRGPSGELLGYGIVKTPKRGWV
jgi:hypothetical protein